MISEMYSKGISDADYNDDKLDEHNPIEIYTQQIRTIFITSVNSVMGAGDMGIDIESLVYEQNLNEKQIANDIREKLELYATLYRDFRTDISVNFHRGINRDIAYINIVVDNNRKLSFFIK